MAASACLRYWGLTSVLATLVVLDCALAPLPAAAADGGLRRFGAHVEINDNDLQGLVAAGAEVKVKGRSSGRVMLLGATVRLDADIADDVYVGGADVTIAGKVDGGLTAFASQLQVESTIQGPLTASASKMVISSGSHIGGETSLAGGDVSFGGEANGPLTIEASTVEISGTVNGPLKIEAMRVHFADGARIVGETNIATIADPEIDKGAILGHVTRRSLPEISALRALSAGGLMGRILPAVVLLGSALMAGLMFLWLGRGGAEGAIDELIDSPAASGGWGLLALIIVPVAVLILAFTIIGAPVGFMALLALPLFLLLGYACAGLGLGEWFFNRLGEPRSAGLRALHLLAGLVVLGAAGLIPWAGPTIIAVATICGLGAMLRMLNDRLRGRATV